MDFATFLGIVIWLFVFPITAAIVAGRKNRSSATWFFVCLFLSPLAILPLLALAPAPSARLCPSCKSVNPDDKPRCRVCGHDFPAARAVPDGLKVCPRCAETVKAAATVCRFCQHEFEGAIGQ